MSVDQLRQSRRTATAVFTEFSRLYNDKTEDLFCFFEGKDSPYYGVRIKNIIGIKDYQPCKCNGKKNVLAVYENISARPFYQQAKLAYFIDRDFDKSIAEQGLQAIYETPCYSIENFYTSITCFSAILKEEFDLTEIDEDFQKCIDLYRNRQQEFHNAVETLNVWIACQREISSNIQLSKITVHKHITITLERVSNVYTLEDIQQIFPDTPIIPPEKLEAKKQELHFSNPQLSFRGKFEIEFLQKFIAQLVQDANKNIKYFKNKRPVKLSIAEPEILSRLSQYADTPDCLRSYLLQFKEH